MRLLLISNEQKSSDWLRRRLEFENNQVIVSSSWQTGSTIAQETPVDIVIQAIQLSDTYQSSGLQLANTDNLDVPLLLIVSPDTPGHKAWALESGADDCVGYMIDNRELMARLKALYRRSIGHATQLPVLQADDLELNLIGRTVYRAGRRIDLLPREYYLLAFLMQNRGRVVSKKEILDHVWTSAHAIRPNTVEVCINHLRKKIDYSPAPKLIHTIVGMGYLIRSSDRT